MGVDLAVVVGHDLDAKGALGLPARLASSAGVTAAAQEEHAALAPRWPNLGPPNTWSTGLWFASSVRRSWAKKRAITVSGASGFSSLYVGPRSLYGVHLEKLGGFLAERSSFRAAVRRLCHALARELGGNRALYLPDSTYDVSTALRLVDAGLGFDEIAARLEADFGAPRRAVDGWWLDDFGDLDS